MNTGSQRSVHHNKRRRQEAREWFVIREPHRDLPPALQKKWERWIADNRNVTVFREYERVDTLLRALPRRPLPTDAELHARVKASGATQQGPALSGFLAQWRDTVTAVISSRVSIAIASAVLIAGIVIIGPHVPSMLFPTRALSYQTGPGHLLTVTLPDHSVVKLGGASRLSVLVSDETRQVTLYDGEAMFNVTHNPRVPFHVDVGATRITDLGTAFHVRRYSDDRQVIVDVTEGAVAVAPREQEVEDVQRQVTVHAGQEVSSDATGRTTPAHAADFQAVAWWLYGRRVYREKPLGRVIEDVQLYFPKRIEYDRPLRSIPFTGIIDPEKTEEWVQGLKEILPVEIDESDPQRVVIRCRQADCEQR